MGFRVEGRKPPKKSGGMRGNARGSTQAKKSATPRPSNPNETVLSEEFGDQGNARVRIVTQIDPVVLAEKKRKRAAAAREAANRNPTRSRGRVRQATQQAKVITQKAEPAQEVAPAPAPKPAEAPAPQAVSSFPLRLLEVRVDDVKGPVPEEGAPGLMRQSIFRPSASDQMKFEIRPEARVSGTKDVVVKVANDGPPAMVALMGFEGPSMRAASATLGTGVEMEIRLEGPLHGHIELSYSPQP